MTTPRADTDTGVHPGSMACLGGGVVVRDVVFGAAVHTPRTTLDNSTPTTTATRCRTAGRNEFVALPVDAANAGFDR